MVDYICTIERNRIGISVTRAMGYPKVEHFTLEDAIKLLNKKLYGLIVARNCVDDKHSFFKSILHVWAQSETIANLLRQAFNSLDLSSYGLDIEGTIILHITICSVEYIYSDKV